MFRLFALTFAFICIVAPAQSQPPAVPASAPLELKLGHNAAFGSVLDLTTAEFARRVNGALRGKAVMKVYGNSVLGSDVDMLKKVQQGELDFAMPSNYMSSINPIFSVFDVPYLILSRQHIKRVRGELLGKFLKPAAKAKGLLILGMWENGFRHMTNNVRPIMGPDDLKGLKIRVPQGSRMLKALQGFGALPAEYSFGPPLVEAIKAGKFDGQENPFTQINSAKLDKVQKYLSLTYHNYTPVYLVAKTERFEKLPPEVQSVIATVAVEMQDWAMAANEQLEKTLRLKLSATMAINEVDLFAFLMASFGFYKEFAAEVPEGKALIKLLYDPTTLTAATKGAD